LLLKKSLLNKIRVTSKNKQTKMLKTYVGVAGFYRIWIPGFGVITKPLYEATWDLNANTWSELGKNKKPPEYFIGIFP
jgi:hypothetical protein